MTTLMNLYASIAIMQLKMMKTRIRSQIVTWISWHLPDNIVMWAYVRVAAHATTGKYETQNMTNLLVIDALRRWEERIIEKKMRKVLKLD